MIKVIALLIVPRFPFDNDNLVSRRQQKKHTLAVQLKYRTRRQSAVDETADERVRRKARDVREERATETARGTKGAFFI